jgi:hypothetical protein
VTTVEIIRYPGDLHDRRYQTSIKTLGKYHLYLCSDHSEVFVICSRKPPKYPAAVPQRKRLPLDQAWGAAVLDRRVEPCRNAGRLIGGLPLVGNGTGRHTVYQYQCPACRWSIDAGAKETTRHPDKSYISGEPIAREISDIGYDPEKMQLCQPSSNSLLRFYIRRWRRPSMRYWQNYPSDQDVSWAGPL